MMGPPTVPYTLECRCNIFGGDLNAGNKLPRQIGD